MTGARTTLTGLLAGVVVLLSGCSAPLQRPAAPDSDRDGVPDDIDQCPAEPEVYDHPDKTPQTADGCPGTRAFVYCPIRSVQLHQQPGGALTPAAERALIGLAQEAARRGAHGHHLFLGIDPSGPGNAALLAAVRAAARRGGLAEGQVRTEHLETRDTFGAPRQPVGEYAPAGSLPPVTLLRVQWRPCPGAG